MRKKSKFVVLLSVVESRESPSGRQGNFGVPRDGDDKLNEEGEEGTSKGRGYDPRDFKSSKAYLDPGGCATTRETTKDMVLQYLRLPQLCAKYSNSYGRPLHSF